MQITGIVVSVTKSKSIEKTDKSGYYDGWELVYKTDNDEVRTIARPSQSLKQVAGLSEALSELAIGDRFVCTMEKEGKFHKIVGLAKGELATPLPASTKKWSGGGGTTTKDFETKEERAIRQKLIVAQSSITAAVETLKTAKGTINKDDVKELAQEYFDWVFIKGQS